MAKKTARANRPAQQRSKEEQWRKRMAAQARTGAAATPVAPAGAAGAVRERERSASAGETYGETSETPAGTSAGRATSAATSARAQSATAALQRRTTASRASSRARFGANALSIDEEMHYIKGDIRRLIVLTAVCLVVIIVLSFVVPAVIR